MDQQTVLHYHLNRFLSTYSFRLRKCVVRLQKNKFVTYNTSSFIAFPLPRVSIILIDFVFHFLS